jgi:hypothetical protein
MKVGTEDKKKLILAGIAGFVLIVVAYYAYSSVFGGTPSPPAQAPVIVDVTPRGAGGSASLARPATTTTGGPVAVKLGTLNHGLDPKLHMGPMIAAESLVYTGTGRNIFAAGPSQAEVAQIVKARFDARPKPQPVQQAPVNYGPPPPPAINLKFFGVATQDGRKRALLLSGEDVFLASIGEVVDRRYKITAVSATSVTVEDLPNNNTQTLPLLAN